MEFEFRQNWKIKSLDEWIARFSKSKKNEEGRSAKTLAEFCKRDDAEKIIAETLHPVVGKIDSMTAYPEYHTKIDDYGKGRIHDLALKCSCGKGNVFVGIEAKVNEGFGRYLKSVYNSSKENSNIKNRINGLLSYYDGMISLDTNPNIPYQLFYSAVSVLKEEVVVKAEESRIFLIIVFNTDKSDEKKVKKNKEKLCDFLTAINAKEQHEYRNESTEYYEAKLKGQKLNIIYKKIDMTK